MDLRSDLTGLTSEERLDERRRSIEAELNVNLSLLRGRSDTIGEADTKNCEQMFGQVPLPVGLAGPLKISLSTGQDLEVFLPLATTEGALVASVNRGCKVLTLADGVRTSSQHIGASRSIAFRCEGNPENALHEIQNREAEWKAVGEKTSAHVKILSVSFDTAEDHLFLTISCDTDEAMGMNMVTIAAEAIGAWIAREIPGVTFVTVAGNVDSDKKPSQRTHDLGRGYEARAEASLSRKVIMEVLKTSPQDLCAVARAKLELGSKIAGAIGANLHAANIIAALYLATGQDAAHVVEGSLADTVVAPLPSDEGVRISVRLPALMIGIRGGGTALPAQHTSLNLLLRNRESIALHPCRLLAEIIAAAVLAGEVSLLAAQASGDLGRAHRKLGR